MNKVISGIKAKTHEKEIATFSYQDIRVDNYQCEKSSFLKDTMSYINLSLEALKKQFKERFKALKLLTSWFSIAFWVVS